MNCLSDVKSWSRHFLLKKSQALTRVLSGCKKRFPNYKRSWMLPQKKASRLCRKYMNGMENFPNPKPWGIILLSYGGNINLTSGESVSSLKALQVLRLCVKKLNVRFAVKKLSEPMTQPLLMLLQLNLKRLNGICLN